MVGPLLMVDTSSMTGSVALVQKDRILGEILLNVKTTHSERLLSAVEQLLAQTDLSLDEVGAFGAVLGPGSFTGLRIGLATVKGLALAKNRPLMGVSSLDALAANISFCRLPVCSFIDARKKEVYAALYDCQGASPKALSDPVVLPPEALLDSLEGEVLFVGDGVEVYRHFLLHQMRERAHFAAPPLNYIRASFAGGLAWNRCETEGPISQSNFVPQYLRPSDAEIMWSKRGMEASIEG